MKKYQLNEFQLKRAFDRFKNEPKIQEALENGYMIYLRENGYVIIKPDALIPHVFYGRGKTTIEKPKLSISIVKKIEANYCLYQ